MAVERWPRADPPIACNVKPAPPHRTGRRRRPESVWCSILPVTPRPKPLAEELAGGWAASADAVCSQRHIATRSARSSVVHGSDREGCARRVRVAHRCSRIGELILGSRPTVRKGGPDFTFIYRGRGSFNLEVTKYVAVRELPLSQRGFLAKLRHLPPSAPNAVLIAAERECAVGGGRRPRPAPCVSVPTLG